MSEVAQTYSVCLSSLQHAIHSETSLKGFYFSFNKLDSFTKKITTKHYNDPVHQYDLQGNYIASFNNTREACLKIGCKNKISSAIKRGESFYGFQ